MMRLIETVSHTVAMVVGDELTMRSADALKAQIASAFSGKSEGMLQFTWVSCPSRMASHQLGL